MSRVCYILFLAFSAYSCQDGKGKMPGGAIKETEGVSESTEISAKESTEVSEGTEATSGDPLESDDVDIAELTPEKECDQGHELWKDLVAEIKSHKSCETDSDCTEFVYGNVDFGECYVGDIVAKNALEGRRFDQVKEIVTYLQDKCFSIPSGAILCDIAPYDVRCIKNECQRVRRPIK